MTIRQTILVVFVAAIVSACCAVAISQALQPQAAKAGGGNAVVSQLKKLNRAIGTPEGGFQTISRNLDLVKGDVGDILDTAQATCEAVGGGFTACH